MIKMKLMGLLIICLLTTIDVGAQSTRDSIIAAVNQLFEGMKNADTILLQRSFSSNAVLQTIDDSKGIATVKDESIAAFISFVGKETRGAADERIVVETVKIDGSLAMVWTPYQFFYKGKFSHCGVNVFELVRLASGWKIQYIIDTRRKTNCL